MIALNSANSIYKSYRQVQGWVFSSALLGCLLDSSFKQISEVFVVVRTQLKIDRGKKSPA